MLLEMWASLIWVALLTAALLIFPRRPRTSGLLFLALAAWSMLLRMMKQEHSPSGFSNLAGAVIWVAMGLRNLIKYRTAAARAAHQSYWSEKDLTAKTGS